MFMLDPCPIPPKPFIRIVEQPSKSLRYRYLCEGRPGTLPGASSTPDNKIPFAIQVVGYEGPAIVLVSCVTKEEPYRPHPHNLVGQNCKKGVCTFKTNFVRDVSVTFPKLAVQCVRRKDAEEALRIRAQEKIDPFRTRFKHSDVKSIDLNVVRLCFQVFIENQYSIELDPIVSDPIYNRKTIPEPLIYKLSHCSCFVDGEKPEIILLCTKIIKSDIKIRFFQTINDQITWEAFGDFQPSHIYNQSAICFKPPPYYDQDIVHPVSVFVQLQRPSDDVSSKAVPFQYLPLDAKPDALKRKRVKQDRIQFVDQLLAGSSKMQQGFGDWNWNVMNNLSRKSSAGTVGSDNWSQPVQILGEAPAAFPTTRAVDFEVDDLETEHGINKLLNIDCQELELQPIHLSSGDLDMPDVNRLSESFQENLSLSDLLI